MNKHVFFFFLLLIIHYVGKSQNISQITSIEGIGTDYYSGNPKFTKNGNEIFLATYGGVYKSLDSGKSWGKFNLGLYESLESIRVSSIASVNGNFYAFNDYSNTYAVFPKGSNTWESGSTLGLSNDSSFSGEAFTLSNQLFAFRDKSSKIGSVEDSDFTPMKLYKYVNQRWVNVSDSAIFKQGFKIGEKIFLITDKGKLIFTEDGMVYDSLRVKEGNISPSFNSYYLNYPYISGNTSTLFAIGKGMPWKYTYVTQSWETLPLENNLNSFHTIHFINNEKLLANTDSGLYVFQNNIWTLWNHHPSILRLFDIQKISDSKYLILGQTGVFEWDLISDKLINRNKGIHATNHESLFVADSVLFTKNHLANGFLVSWDKGNSWMPVGKEIINHDHYYPLEGAPNFFKVDKNIFAFDLKRNLFYSGDKGKTWNKSFFPSFEIGERIIGYSSDGLFFRKLEWGSPTVYKSIDQGNTWDWYSNAFPGMRNSQVVGIGNVIYGFNWSTDIYKSRDNGENWVLYNTNIPTGFYPNLNFKFSGGKVFLTGSDALYYDNGSSWEQVYDYYVNDVALIKDVLFISQYYFGMMYSKDMGKTWDQLQGLEKGVIVESIQNIGDEIYLGTLASGIYHFNLSEMQLSTNKPDDTKSPIKFYPNPVSDKLTIELNRNLNEKVLVEIMDVRGLSIISNDLPAQEGLISIHNTSLKDLNPGIYFCKIITSEGVYLQRFFKD